MSYKTRLAPPAARTFEVMHRLATGASGSTHANTFQLLETLVDEVIPSSPFSGAKLPEPLSGAYFISKRTLQVIYEVNVKTQTVSILAIVDAPTREENARQADIICAEIAQSGKVQFLPPGTIRRAAAN